MTWLPLVAVTIMLGGCASASRAQARGAVVTTAEAIKLGDAACGRVALERSDVELTRACEKAYDAARAAIVTAASGVDAWNAGKRDEVQCAVTRAAGNLAKIAEELRKRNADVSPEIDDALRLVTALGGCRE